MKKTNLEDARIVFEAGSGKIRGLQKRYNEDQLRILEERERMRRQLILAKKELAFWEGGIWGFSRTTFVLSVIVFAMGFRFSAKLNWLADNLLDKRVMAGSCAVAVFLACWNMFDFGRIKLSMYMWWHERGTVDDLLNELCAFSRAEKAIKEAYERCERGKEEEALTSKQICDDLDISISVNQVGKIMAKLDFHKKRVNNDRMWLIKRRPQHKLQVVNKVDFYKKEGAKEKPSKPPKG